MTSITLFQKLEIDYPYNIYIDIDIYSYNDATNENLRKIGHNSKKHGSIYGRLC